MNNLGKDPSVMGHGTACLNRCTGNGEIRRTRGLSVGKVEYENVAGLFLL